MKEITVTTQKELDDFLENNNTDCIIKSTSKQILDISKKYNYDINLAAGFFSVSGNCVIKYAYDNCVINCYSSKAKINKLFDVVVLILNDCIVKTKKTKYVTVVRRSSKNISPISVKKWAIINNVDIVSGRIKIYKKVSKDFKTQEGNTNETDWKIGSIVKHSNWKPKQDECGENKFHACSKPYFCDEFRNEQGDRYIAIEVELKDTYAWPNPAYPYKIAFRKGKVIFEVDKFGKELK